MLEPGAPLVVERDLPDGSLQLARTALAVGDQLTAAIALRAGRHGAVRLLDERAHVEGHRGEVEGRLDQCVVEIEDAQRHAETVPQACYHEPSS